MAEEKNNRYDFGKLGIILGVSFVLLSIVWLSFAKFFHDDNKNEITWVG